MKGESPMGSITPDSTSRRQWVVAAAASVTLILPMRQADTRSAGDAATGWLAMVKSHHEAISRSFDALLDGSEAARMRREGLMRALSFQMTAHAVAEENVIYPALAISGLVSESDRLYLEQAHFKVQLAMINAIDAQQRDSAQWLGAVRELRDVVLLHARRDEEELLFPRLALQLDDQANQTLALAYDREYAQVRGVAATQIS